MKGKLVSVLLTVAVAVSLMAMPAVTSAAGPVTVVLGGDVAVASGALGTTNASHIGSGCWEADKAQTKMELYIAPTVAPFSSLGSFTIGQIASISYWTNKPGTPQDFFLAIYTVPDGKDDTAGWYGYRLNGEPYFSRNLSAPNNTWNEWNTSVGTNQLTFFDTAKTGNYGFYGQPTLQDLQATNSFNWDDWGDYSATAIDYGNETVKSISFQTGSGWASTFDGYIDDITITLTTGKSLTIDLEKGTSSVNLGVKVPEITAISVTPTTWDFGEVSPGSYSDVGVSITNTGTVPIKVSTVLSPAGSVFDSYLYFPWNDGLVKYFSLSSLVGGASYSNTARLNIPRSYHAHGVETGLLVFEATAV